MGRDGRPRKTRAALERALVTIVAAALGASLAAAQSGREREQLQAVRNEIKAVEQRLAAQTAQRDDGARGLRGAETEIAAANRKLGEVRASLRTQQARRRALDEQTARAAKRLDAERLALGNQVRMSYMTGREEAFKLLLSQDSAAAVGRMLVYYEYFNRARGVRIDAVTAQLKGLDELRATGEEVGRELAALETAQAGEVATLARARDQRKAALAKIDADIGDATAKIGKLRAEEKRLAELLAELTAATAGFPVATDQPFASFKGKLAWPVQGRLLGDYGQPRDGGPLKWSGVLLEASAGTPVRAIYHGRVAFADWLPGLGLLAIVDHGDGYMSLYGHNEALLREPGDWVEPGEAIGQVGDTGGLARPALYFEIRQNGEPVNPNAWVARKPAAR
jgi:septal ring factor EnvC (AmiA/AmiB activator)